MEWIAANSVRLCTLALGAGAGTPVVMLHGWVTGNMATWYPAYAVPLAQGRRVLLYDQRGHGESRLESTDHAVGYDLDSQADDLRDVVDHHGEHDARVDIVGYSMGALTALRFALRYPQRVRRLVLVDAPWPANHCIGPSLRAVDSPRALHAFLGEQAEPAGGRRYARLYERASRMFFATSLVRDVEAMEAESPERLARLAAPVLLVYGAESPFRAAGPHLAADLPHARLEWLPGAHDLIHSQTDALLAAIRRFLGEP